MGRVGSDVIIMASAVVVLTGLAALTRSILRVVFTLRDNTSATKTLTGRLDMLAARLDQDFARLEKRVTVLERARRRGLSWVMSGGRIHSPPRVRSPDGCRSRCARPRPGSTSPWDRAGLTHLAGVCGTRR